MQAISIAGLSIVRKEWETFAADSTFIDHIPTAPDAIDRMLETMKWVQWLEVEQRHLVWMRAKRYGWQDITIRFACDRTTAWRRWQRALEIVTRMLNKGRIIRKANKISNFVGQRRVIRAAFVLV